ncbi:MAG: DUF2934 domain-containing protein [Chromatiales bacterium]|jgi:hypothetical protein
MTDEKRFNPSTYDSVKAHLKSSLEHVIAAGHNVREFSEFTLEKFGDTYVPYLRQFLSDVSKGEIKIKGLTKAAKTAIMGEHVSQEQRLEMIREAAYYRAEKRGFAPGFEEQDWAAAEQEIDTRLAEEAGLIYKGRKVLESTASSIEKEFDNLKAVVTDWLEEKYGSVKKSVAAERPMAQQKKATSRPAGKKTASRKGADKEPTA